ncbi:hypothetical protein [uncultured Rikenella sp.]|uniref:hypothetical protein n=1 Tax=uncultured Rikenella sp. TaxID=368003 RepID=UPI0025F09BEB|nr:hypothetical protein [uncultured Rikenella sp.]
MSFEYHPAPGCRGSASGALGNIGNNGYSWSSAVSGTNGVFLGFYTQSLNPSSVDYRGYGLQLRCLSEETEKDERFFSKKQFLNLKR